MADLDPFFYARDHDRGPGAWCVRGPNDFKMAVPDKMLALAIGKLLSGEEQEAAAVAELWVQSHPVGPTGEFPEGKLNDDDEGELIIAVSTEDGNVRIDLGKKVKWMAFPPDVAIQLAGAILTRAKEISEAKHEIPEGDRS